MSHDGQTHIGQRIKAIRTQRGLTQVGLSQRAHVSYSTITKVESGHLPASPVVSAACAHALRVPITDLTGQPYFDELKRDGLEELVQPIRHAIANPLLPSESEIPLRPLVQVQAEIRTLEESRLRGEYMAIGTAAPTLIDELIQIAHVVPSGRQREDAYYTLAMVYRLANSFAHKLGFMDLSLLALDRMESAAAQSGDPFLSTVVTHYRGDYFLYHAGYEIGLRSITATEKVLDESARRGDMRALSAMGTMNLKAAVMHARKSSPTAAADSKARITEARKIAARTSGQPDPYGLVFDRLNVEIHATAISIDLGEVGTAVETGEKVALPEGWALNRAGHHHMDMARAYERTGQNDKALSALMRARTAAPAQTRYHPTARETVLALLRGRGTPARELTSYARWLGV